jgi:hypothetical protein
MVPVCAGGGTTTITGRLFAGNGVDPVPGATIYVPVQDVVARPPGASCDLCGQTPASVSSATTAFDGSFTLSGVPAGTFPVVAQLGHFQRVVNMTATPCVANTIPADAGTANLGIRLPRKTAELSAQDTVPHIAVASGDFDQIECVLKRMGIDEIDVYNGRDPGTTNPPAIAELSTLLTNQAKLLSYNILVINCTQNQFQATLASAGVKANIEKFVASGGRLYATDWAYDMIEQIPQFAPYLCFEPQAVGGAPMCQMTSEPVEDADTMVAYSGKSSIQDPDLVKWLSQFPGAIDAQQKVEVDFSYVAIAQASTTVASPVKVWVQGQAQNFGVKPQTVTFDYNQCGRIHYSTYNTEPNGAVDDTARWPNNCKATFSPQERLLEYLVFNIASCIPTIG